VTDLAERSGAAEAGWKGLSALMILALGLPLLPQPAAGQPALPDLSISPKDVSISNSSPAEGEPVFINATVHVSAGEPAGPATVELLVDNKVRGLKEASIDPNITVRIISFEWWTTGGHHNVAVVLDPANEIAESNEGNNAASVELDVRGRPPAPAGMDWPLVLSALFCIACVVVATTYLFCRSRGGPRTDRGTGIDAEVAAAAETVRDAERLGIDVAGAPDMLDGAEAAARVGDAETARRLAGEAMRGARKAMEDSFERAAVRAEEQVSEAERAGADTAGARALLARARSLEKAGEHGWARSLVTEALEELKKTR
jgi:hypothetical protein